MPGPRAEPRHVTTTVTSASVATKRHNVARKKVGELLLCFFNQTTTPHSERDTTYYIRRVVFVWAC